MTTALFALVCGCLGLAIGSFLNVVIWRVPRHESIVAPPSHCPVCEVAISPRDNVPVLSWLLLRGRCRACGAPIAARYPLVELATAALFAGLALKLGPHAVLPAYLYLAATGLALALIDLDVHRLPDALTLPAYLAGPALLAIGTAGGAWWPLIRAVIGLGIYYALFFMLWFVHPAGMGWGDVKLAGVLGLFLAWLGWGQLTTGVALGVLLGGVVAIGLLLTRRAGRKSGIPFGPFMVAGALIAVFAGAPIAHGYLRLTGVA